jgi:hypothetical protein
MFFSDSNLTWRRICYLEPLACAMAVELLILARRRRQHFSLIPPGSILEKRQITLLEEGVLSWRLSLVQPCDDIRLGKHADVEIRMASSFARQLRRNLPTEGLYMVPFVWMETEIKARNYWQPSNARLHA